MIFGSNGSLYGITANGGPVSLTCPGDCGSVYQLTPPATPRGKWSETTLHFFVDAGDGHNPNPGLIRDFAGALFGVVMREDVHLLVSEPERATLADALKSLKSLCRSASYAPFGASFCTTFPAAAYAVECMLSPALRLGQRNDGLGPYRVPGAALRS